MERASPPPSSAGPAQEESAITQGEYHLPAGGGGAPARAWVLTPVSKSS